MTDFSRSYSSKWRVYKVDRDTWADAGEMHGFLSADISASRGDMLQSGSFSFQSSPYTDFPEGYYRLVMYATQDSLTERHEIATLYCTSSGGTVSKGSDVKVIEGRSVLNNANCCSVEDGTTVTKGSNGVSFVKDLLDSVLDAPVVASGGFTVSEHFTFAIGTSILEAVWTILDSGGWCMQISGDGTVRVVPLPTEPSLTLDADGNGILMPEESYDMDTSSVPNRYMATDGTNVGIARNQSATSPVSITSRGFVVDAEPMIDSSPLLIEGESLDQYCMRKLKELSVVYNARSYEREYAEDVYPYSLVRREYGSDLVDSRIESQTLKCGTGIIVR